MEKLLLTVAEAAALCSIGQTKAYELIASGQWRAIRIGRLTRVPRAWLEEWVAEQVKDQDKLAA